MVNGWKITAIIFIVLFFLAILLMVYSVKIATKIVDQENKCVINICSGLNDRSYFYDEYLEVCECYNMYGELTKSRYLGGK